MTPDHVVVGTAGHIDHGKSTLVRALTGTDPDRLPEERRRGITIDLGFAYRTIDGVTFSFVDVPGHERFVHNMLAGATGVDLLLLVVAADESVMPQTREHLGICRLLGLSAGVIALTRVDLAGDDLTAVAHDEVQELVRGTFLEDAPIVPVSGATGAGLPDLERALAGAAARLAPRADGPWARLPVDRVFAAKGFGTVVTGTLGGAELRVGQTLEAVPGGLEARVRGLQVHGAAVETAGPQRRVAVNLQGIDRERLARGMVLVPPGRGVTASVFDAALEVLGDAPAGLEDGQRVRLHHGTAEIFGRLRLPAPGRLEPGAKGAVQVRLEAPLVALPGDRFVVRRYSPVVTLAGGVIVDLDPPRWRRADPAWGAHVARLAAATPLERLAVAAEGAGEDGFVLGARGLRLGLTPEHGKQRAAELAGARAWLLLGGSVLLAATAAAALEQRLRRTLSAHHRERPLEPGPAPERLRAALAPDWPAEAFRDWLLRLAEAKAIVVTSESVRLASHRGDLDEPDRERLARLLAVLESAGLEALAEEEWIARAGTGADGRRLVPFAVRRGAALRLPDGAYLGKSAWDGLLQRMREEAAAGRTEYDVAAFKELFGLTRKYAIPLLERLDDAGVTQRVGNQRRIRSTWTAARNGE